MFKTLSFILRLRNCYRANNIIFLLRSLPFAKKILPESLYGVDGLKVLVNIIAAFIEFTTIFIGKLLYFIVLFFLIDSIYLEFGLNLDFMHVFMFFTLAGAVCNNRFDNATKDSYYAIFLMKLPAKKYALAEMGYFLFKSFVGFIAFALLSGFLVGLNTFEVIIIPLLVVCSKIILMPFMMNYSQRYNKAMGRNYLLILIGIVLCAIGIALGAFGIHLTQSIFYIITPLLLVVAAFSLNYVLKYKHFKEFYKKLFVTDIQLIAPNTNKVKKDMLKSYTKQITISEKIKSNKKGFAYFNDLFVKRHRKILMRAAVVTAIIAAIIFVIIGVACILDVNIKTQINEFILLHLSYLLFIMYFVNCGNRASATMFANCDNAMLKYGFYRKPSSLLKNFANRLISVIQINLVPGMVIAISLPLLLYVSGGTDNISHYFIIFASVIAMSVFFSVHSMVLYYLLQPYNSKMELKSALFSIVNTATYFICFYAIGKETSLLGFGIAITAFCIIYIIIALVLAYKLAPKTFRLRD